MKKLVRRRPYDAGTIASVIQQMQADPELNNALMNHNATEGNVNVQKWLEQYKRGNSLWRMKIWEPDKGTLIRYRMIYGYIKPSQGRERFCILAVVHRGDFNYESDSEIGQRIIQDYQALL